MKPMERLSQLGQTEPDHAFDSGCEMAGYYCAHMLEQIWRFGAAPTQICLPGFDVDQLLSGKVADLRSTLFGSDFVGVGIIARDLKQKGMKVHRILVSVRDDRLRTKVDMMLPYALTRGIPTIQEAQILDLVGPDLHELKLARVDALVDFNHGFYLYGKR